MNLLIAGATGGTGRALLTLALSEGHHVSALCRRPEALDLTHPRLRIVQGDVCDPETCARAVAGQDAVMVCLGAPALTRTSVRATGTATLIDAMNALGVRRLLCVSVLGAGETRALLPFFLKYVVFPLYLRGAVIDHEHQEEVVRRSGLDWTIIRPPHLTDGPSVGGVHHGFDDLAGLSMKISRADLAAFMLEELNTGTYIGGSPAVSYAA
ncbi:MAG: NAD(P)-dependent oxidoreductase [Myxococcota bacterium]